MGSNSKLGDKNILKLGHGDGYPAQEVQEGIAELHPQSDLQFYLF